MIEKVLVMKNKIILAYPAERIKTAYYSQASASLYSGGTIQSLTLSPIDLGRTHFYIFNTTIADGEFITVEYVLAKSPIWKEPYSVQNESTCKIETVYKIDFTHYVTGGVGNAHLAVSGYESEEFKNESKMLRRLADLKEDYSVGDIKVYKCKIEKEEYKI